MKKRFEALDCLRGIAALIVLVHHYINIFPDLYKNIPVVPWRMSSSWANHAVHLFFIISGFVIFMSLSRINKPMEFVKARFFRLFPTFWTVVTFTTLLLIFVGLPDKHVGLIDYLLNMTMIPKFLSVGINEVRYIDGSYWTLEWEFFFYVIMFILLCTRATKHVDWVMLGLLTFSVIFLKLPVINLFIQQKINYLTLSTPIAYFAAGVFIYRWKENPQQYFKYGGLLLCDLLVIGLAEGKMGIIISALLMAVVYVSSTIQRLPVITKPFIFFGTISYSIYLVHQTLGYILIRELGLRGVNPYIGFFVACGASVLVATAICFGVEKPVMVYAKLLATRKTESLKLTPDGPIPEQA